RWPKLAGNARSRWFKASPISTAASPSSRTSSAKRRIDMSASSPLRVLAVANQKGGVGKTTTAINLGTALAAIGEKVLILDIDPQGDASTAVGVAEDQRHITSSDILSGRATIAQAGAKTVVPNLSVVPANAELVGLESEMMAEQGRPFRLRDAISALQAEQ